MHARSPAGNLRVPAACVSEDVSLDVDCVLNREHLAQRRIIYRISFTVVLIINRSKEAEPQKTPDVNTRSEQ